MNKPFKGTNQYLSHYHIHELFSYISKIYDMITSLTEDTDKQTLELEHMLMC